MGKPTLNKFYKFESGNIGEFISPIEKDGMYNVFRQTENFDFKPIYTNENFETAYGDKIIEDFTWEQGYDDGVNDIDSCSNR